MYLQIISKMTKCSGAQCSEAANGQRQPEPKTKCATKPVTTTPPPPPPPPKKKKKNPDHIAMSGMYGKVILHCYDEMTSLR